MFFFLNNLLLILTDWVQLVEAIKTNDLVNSIPIS